MLHSNTGTLDLVGRVGSWPRSLTHCKDSGQGMGWSFRKQLSGSAHLRASQIWLSQTRQLLAQDESGQPEDEENHSKARRPGHPKLTYRGLILLLFPLSLCIRNALESPPNSKHISPFIPILGPWFILLLFVHRRGWQSDLICCAHSTIIANHLCGN